MIRRVLLLGCMLSSTGCLLATQGLGEGESVTGPDAVAQVDTSIADVSVVDASPADASFDAWAPDVPDAPDVLDVADVEDSADAPDAADADDASDAADATDAAEAGVPCSEPGAVQAFGHCYFLGDASHTFSAARTACEASGAHLVTITSAEEQNVVRGLGEGDRWIGLSKPSGSPSAKSSFVWVTGEASTAYDNWAPGDPNGGHDCARMQADGKWADIACTSTYPFVCERE